MVDIVSVVVSIFKIKNHKQKQQIVPTNGTEVKERDTIHKSKEIKTMLNWKTGTKQSRHSWESRVLTAVCNTETDISGLKPEVSWKKSHVGHEHN